MKVELKRINEPYHFEATNQTGNSIHIDASPQIGGTDKGVRPMELLLMGLAGCASIDVISILRKQRFTIEDFKVTVDGERETEKEANLFTDNIALSRKLLKRQLKLIINILSRGKYELS